jgi:hypothetical protein
MKRTRISSRILIDHHTRYPALVPTKNQPTKITIPRLDRALRHSSGHNTRSEKSFHSDKQNVPTIDDHSGNSELANCCPPPSLHGRVERNNRVINSALTHVVNALQTDWYLRLTYQQFTLHTSLHSATGISPMEMMTSLAPCLPTNIFSCVPGTLLDSAERKLVELPLRLRQVHNMPLKRPRSMTAIVTEQNFANIPSPSNPIPM